MTKYRIFGIVGVLLLILLALIMVPSKAAAHNDHHTATPTATTEVPPHCTDGNGDDNDHKKHCNPTATSTPSPTATDTPTQVVTDEPTATPTAVITDEPSATPTDASPTPPDDDPTASPTPTATDGSPVPQTVTPTAAPRIAAKVTCDHKCVYNLGGIPGTHAVTAVSPNADGPYYWQIKFGDVWYDVYDCYGIIITTTAESRGETTITRLIVDSSAPTDSDSYRIVGGAGAILFDDHTY